MPSGPIDPGGIDGGNPLKSAGSGPKLSGPGRGPIGPLNIPGGGGGRMYPGKPPGGNDDGGRGPKGNGPGGGLPNIAARGPNPGIVDDGCGNSAELESVGVSEIEGLKGAEC